MIIINKYNYKSEDLIYGKINNKLPIKLCDVKTVHADNDVFNRLILYMQIR